MNKESFLNALREKLTYLEKEDAEERIAFYGEMIDDRVEEGMSEEEAVAAIGTVEEISERIMSEIPLHSLVIKKVKPKKQLKGWEIALLILALPVLLPLVIMFIALILSVYVLMWSVVITVFAVAASMMVSAIAAIPSAVAFFIAGNAGAGLLSIGVGLLFAGLFILMVLASVAVTKGVIKLTEKFLLWIKSLFVTKEVSDHEFD